MLFITALLVLLAGSLPWVAVIQPPNKPSWLVAVYMVCCANLTLTGYIGNSFHLLDRQWVMLTIHAVIGGAGWLVWRRGGKLPLGGPFQGWKAGFDVRWLKREPLLVAFVFMTALAYAFALVQIIHIPQNNMDSLSTHLSRIGFWRQNGSFFPWPTFLPNQVWYPVNAQLQTYWTLLFLGGDQLVGAVQWLAALVSALGIFGMARSYGYNPRQSAFAALVFLGFPLVALQSTTTQTDLVTVAFFIPAVYFLILGLRDGQNSLLTLSAISVGLGIGVKKSYFLLLPILAIIALLALFHFGRRNLKQLAFWSLSLIAMTAIFGAYTYAMNWSYFGEPFGAPAYIDTLIDTPQYEEEGTIRNTPRRARFATMEPSHLSGPEAGSAFDAGILMEVVYNAPRLFYQFLDTSGLPDPLDGYAHKVKARLARAFFQWIGFEEIEGTAYAAPGHTFDFSEKNINEESHAWYGPLSVLLLLPALIFAPRRGLQRGRRLLWMPATALLVFLPMEIILRPGWDPFQGRYFAPLVALGAPLMATWFREKGNPLHEWLVAGLAVVVLSVTLLYNPSKPTLGKFADEFHVWDNDRIFVQTIQRKKNRDTYYLVEKLVPANATLGYYIPHYIMDYPFFGQDLERRLVPMVSPAQISDLQWLREQGIDYLLIPGRDADPLPPPEYEILGTLPGWDLYVYLSP